MNLEQTLTDELRTIAAAAQAPPPPAPETLVRAAGRARRRTLATRVGATGLVAAAVVAAIVLGSQVGRPHAAPSPAKPTPSYAAPGVPYLFDGGLYVDHRRQPGEWFTVQSFGDHTIALAADSTATILRDGHEVMHVDGVVQAVSLSFDGTKAAWLVDDGPGHGILVVRDLASSRELGRLRFAIDPAAGFSLTVRNDGTAYYDAGNRSWRWVPGSAAPVPSEQQPSQLPEHPAGFDGVPAPVRLSPDHLWGAWLTGPDGAAPADPEGHQLGLTVQRPGDPRSRFTIPVPPGSDVAPIPFWLSPTTINLTGQDQLLCDIVARTCRKGPTP